MSTRAKAWSLLSVQLLLIAAIMFLPGGTTWALAPWVSSAAWFVEFAGLAVVAAGLVNLGRSATPLPTPVPNGRLKSRWLYGLVRHPIYSGMLLAFLGMALAFGEWRALLALALVFASLARKSRIEEGFMRETFPEYTEYQRETRALIPFVY